MPLYVLEDCRTLKETVKRVEQRSGQESTKFGVFGVFENSTRWKSCKRVQIRGRGAWACLAHALQCLCDGCALLPSPCPATRNLCVLEVSPAPAPCCFNSLSTGTVRVGVKIPQDGNRANKYEHVAVVHEHVWGTLCSVCMTGARVAPPLFVQLVISVS